MIRNQSSSDSQCLVIQQFMIGCFKQFNWIIWMEQTVPPTHGPTPGIGKLPFTALRRPGSPDYIGEDLWSDRPSREWRSRDVSTGAAQAPVVRWTSHPATSRGPATWVFLKPCSGSSHPVFFLKSFMLINSNHNLGGSLFQETTSCRHTISWLKMIIQQVSQFTDLGG